MFAFAAVAYWWPCSFLQLDLLTRVVAHAATVGVLQLRPATSQLA